MHDESLLCDIPSGVKVIKAPIWEPFDLYKRLMGKKDENLLLPERIGVATEFIKSFVTQGLELTMTHWNGK